VGAFLYCVQCPSYGSYWVGFCERFGAEPSIRVENIAKVQATFRL
jgi:hypothetical protein